MSHGDADLHPLPGKPGGIQVDRVNRALDMEGVEGAWEGQVRDVLIRESDDPQAAALELEDAACGPFRRGSAAGAHGVAAGDRDRIGGLGAVEVKPGLEESRAADGKDWVAGAAPRHRIGRLREGDELPVVVADG